MIKLLQFHVYFKISTDTRLQTLLHVEPVQIYDKEDRRFKGENQETL